MKLYVGNLGDEGTVKSEDLRPLFEQFGAVTECECIKNYAFVHMEDGDKATEAVAALNGTTIKGRPIKVEKSESRGPRKPSQKLFVGNLAEGTTNAELKELFERYAPVIEADIIKNFGFVHIDADAGKGKINEILRELNGFSLNGSQIRVQQSTSGVRQKPGMGGDQCYRCGRDGHWSKECPLYPDPPGSYDSSGGAARGGGGSPGGRGGPMRGAAPYGSRNMGGGHGYRGGDPYPPPPPPSYMRERGGYDAGNGYANSGEYGSRQMGGSGRAMATDPYGRPAQQVYDDRRGGYSAVPMGGSRDMMRAADPYGRYDSGQDMAYSQHPMGNPGGYGDAGTYGSGYGGQMQAGSSVPAYSTQPAYATGTGGSGGGSDAYSRRSDGSASQRSESAYGVAPRGMPGGGQGYGQPQQQPPPSGYGSGRGYGVY